MITQLNNKYVHLINSAFRFRLLFFSFESVGIMWKGAKLFAELSCAAPWSRRRSGARILEKGPYCVPWLLSFLPKRSYDDI